MSIVTDASTSILIIVVMLVCLGCQEQSYKANRALADSLDDAAERKYDAGHYRPALHLYQKGLGHLQVKTTQDSILKASLLLGVAYSRYHLGMKDRAKLWLDALRYVQADEDAFDVVQTMRAVASLHAREHQYDLEILSLRKADSLAQSQSLADSITSEVQSDLTSALYDCYRVSYCTIPQSTQKQPHSLETWIAAFVVFIVVIGMLRFTKIRGWTTK